MVFSSGSRSASLDNLRLEETPRLFQQHIPLKNKNKWMEFIRKQHDELYKYIIDRCQQTHYQKIIIICGSHRQNGVIDVFNSVKGFYFYTGSCALGLESLQNELSKRLAKKIPTYPKILS